MTWAAHLQYWSQPLPMQHVKSRSQIHSFQVWDGGEKQDAK